ncbi:hypothetical protein BKA70DRAFT_1565591 [Coprinopsis sp. MPI-PUGE-AT-0042]|nr:hypothetical protein BKA70DRAFT_1565591 [Coprinopsis sp. MPI-PUGE-AT-0042]
MATSLPRELLLEIVSHLEEDTACLREMALASSVFRSACQAVLFSKICFSFDVPSVGSADIPLGALADLYRQSPVLLTYTKSVTVRGRRNWMAEPPALAPSFTEAIKMLAQQGLKRVKVEWGTLWTPEIQESFEALIQCPTLVSLHLAHLPAQILHGIRSSDLKELHIQSMLEPGPGSAADAPLPPSPPSFQLQSLYLETGRFELAFAQKLGLKGLKNLTLKKSGHPASPDFDAGLIIASCATTLETLRFSTEMVRWNPDRFVTPESIGQLQRLKTLTVDCDGYSSGSGRRANVYPWLLNLLDHLPAPCAIGKLRFQISFQARTEVDQVMDFWNSVDAKLASRQQFPKLAGVAIEVYTSFPEVFHLSDDDLEFVLEMLATEIRYKLFPKLRSGGLLVDPKLCNLKE